MEAHPTGTRNAPLPWFFFQFSTLRQEGAQGF